MSTHKYDDIMNLPHHVSETRPRMSLHDRAAQFSPFAALSGYHEAVREAARETDARPELDEEEKAVIDAKLRLIQAHLSELPKVKFTFFEPDVGKDGGQLVILDGAVSKIDVRRREIVFSDGQNVPIDDILDIDCDSPLGE